MVSEVETILNEIRDRVLAQEKIIAREADVLTTTPSANGAREASANHHESLTRISAHLSVTARAWDRLPPLISNRRGALARLELWIKKTFKPLTRWFTWEQVNFNAAVHHALLDALTALTLQEQELVSLRSALIDERSARINEAASRANEAASHEEKLEAINREVESLRTHIAEMPDRLRNVDESLAQLSTMLTEFAAETRAGQSQLANEIIAAANDLREEQRVCFKQLSLEASEAAILEDRGRRALEARLQTLESASTQTSKQTGK